MAENQAVSHHFARMMGPWNLSTEYLLPPHQHLLYTLRPNRIHVVSSSLGRVRERWITVVSRTKCCHPTERSHASSIKSIAGSATAKKKGSREKGEEKEKNGEYVGQEETLSNNRKGCRQIIDCGGKQVEIRGQLKPFACGSRGM